MAVQKPKLVLDVSANSLSNNNAASIHSSRKYQSKPPRTAPSGVARSIQPSLDDVPVTLRGATLSPRKEQVVTAARTSVAPTPAV